jgi:hypothetical protein
MQPGQHHNERPKPTGRPGPILIGTVVAIALVLIIVLHLTGVVGPNGH